MEDKGKIVTRVDLCTGQTITCLLNKSQKIETQLVGFAEEQFLLLQFPYIAGIRNLLLPGQTFAAHLRLSQSVIFFSSTVEHTIEKKRLVVSSYPASFKVFEARSKERFSCFLPVSLSAGDTFMQGVTSDISASGCHIIIDTSYYKTARFININGIISVEFGINHSSGFVVSAEVLFLRTGLAATHLGLRFSSIAPDDSEHLKNIIQRYKHEITV